MARYTGPREKIARRFGVPLFGPSKALELRNFPPGQHGVRNARRKSSGAEEADPMLADMSAREQETTAAE